MENLDPLRQKPDFERVVTHEAKYQRLFQSAGRDYIVWANGWVDGSERLWLSHVEPLMKQLEILKSNDRDKFAIGFAEWIKDNRWMLEPVNYVWQKNYAYKLPDMKTTAELLELYKESLLNQKP